jgi:uncharacterized protein YbbC (DUF1343 family)/CubicO group peptidase (beta-lactamase class C family)
VTKIRILLCLLLLPLPAATQSQPWPGAARVDAVIQQAIADGAIPGAVVIVGRDGRVLHRKAYGYRSLQPRREEMTLDTIFDFASLTKVMATAPAIVQLTEQGRIRLGDRLTAYLPDFAGGNSGIRLHDLLTHFSGLRPDLDLEPQWSGYETALQKAYQEKPVAAPGERFIYSDINFILLAEVVRRVSGESFDAYVRSKILEPLEMNDTYFRPSVSLWPRIAPSAKLASGDFLRGVVHDPTTRFMGGVAGHAGLFSTGDDLSRFAEMMLAEGQIGEGPRVLSVLSVLAMTAPRSPGGQPVLRGFGWDIDSPYASPRGDLFPIGSYGHTGFTGTSLWIDPFTKTYVILLTSRLHAGPGTSVVSLRGRLANIVAASLEGAPSDRIRGIAGRARAESAPMPTPRQPVLAGLDVLARDGFQPFLGKRVGLITNHTGIDRQGRRNIDLLWRTPGVKLSAIFSPEHGLEGRLDQSNVGNTIDGATGVPVHSLYQGENRRPRAEVLKDLDVLIFDIQDVGTRFYTYLTTMAYALEEAAKHKLPFYVLDRPNPITGRFVEGPVLEDAHRSFIGYFPVPVRHGMTAGELALLFNGERSIGADLTVARMEGWRRETWFDETELPWVNPSPNIRNLDQALLYPGVGLLEGFNNWSVGRGTDTPFQFAGSNWSDGKRLAAYLNQRGLPGVRFYAVTRTPSTSRFEGVPLEGVQISVLDRDALQPARVGLEMIAALRTLYPGHLDVAEIAKWIGNEETMRGLNNGRNPASIWAAWEAEITRFQETRQRYLLY